MITVHTHSRKSLTEQQDNKQILKCNPCAIFVRLRSFYITYTLLIFTSWLVQFSTEIPLALLYGEGNKKGTKQISLSSYRERSYALNESDDGDELALSI